MKTCPHCGQSVRAEGSTCPLCRQDMGGPSSLPQSIDTAWNSSAERVTPDRLTALERLWAGRSDDALEEAAHTLLEYTEEGQRAIREELRRRSIEIPGPESQPESKEEESAEVVGGTGVLIYGNPDRLHVDDLQGTLKSHGIACEIRRSRSGPLSSRPWPELWILDESQTEHARQIVQAALDEAPDDNVSQELEGDREGGIDRGLEADDEPIQASHSWTCPQCAEDVESLFSECWKCGSERPLAPGI